MTAPMARRQGLTARSWYVIIVIIYQMMKKAVMRTIVDIPDNQLQQLDAICDRDDLSRAEAVRQAISLFVEEHSTSPDAAFGMWKDRGMEGVHYQQAIRGEWAQ